MKIEIAGKPQTIGYMAVYNEADYVEYSIRSVIEHVDGMVVMEGAFRETVQAGGSMRSDDGTLDILSRLQKEFGHKLNVIKIANLSQLRHRSWVFDVIPINFPLIAQHDYWLWLVDADEVYDVENIKNLKRILGSTQSDVIKVDSLTFVNDFRHYVKIAFPRCFRICADYNYQFCGPNHLVSSRAHGENGWSAVGPEENHEDSVRFFHYSYVKDPARFSLKKKERELVHGQFKWELDENNRVVSSGVNIRTFDGKHPEVMRGHPRHE